MLHPLAVLLHALSIYFASDGEALSRTAPEPLDVIAAAHHVAAAELVGWRFNVDPNLVLSIAAHESHYQQGARTAEPGGLVSCGVMTPIPRASCDEEPGIFGDWDDLFHGYAVGAEHLRGWIDAAHGDIHAALLGYAGGYVLIRACKEGRVERQRGGRTVDICSIADVFLYRAEVIRRERRRGGPPQHPPLRRAMI